MKMKPSVPYLLFSVIPGMILFYTILPGCTGTPPVKPGNGYRAGVFPGVSSGRYLSKDRALALALRDAARRVSFFHSVEAAITSSEIYNPQFRISQVNEERELVYDTDYEKYVPFLQFDPDRDVYEEHGALFVQALYTGETGTAAGYRRGAGTLKPSWVEHPPEETGGLLCAVGVAGSRLSYKDMVIASYEDAVCAFVKNSFSKTYASQQTGEYAMLDSSVVHISGIVKGFHVLETWRDPKSGALWTLAAAREVIRKTTEE
ncbi:MAG: hypothetical protein LBU19_08335 [Treponema sp.]|jgi:hypothetical protein|nr:hypothetical protein [Treponema sp.]